MVEGKWLVDENTLFKGLDGNYYYDQTEEFNAVNSENAIRSELGYDPRAYYRTEDLSGQSKRAEDIYPNAPDYVIDSMKNSAKEICNGNK